MTCLSGAVFVFPDLGLIDVDNDTVASAMIRLSNFDGGSEYLGVMPYDNQTITATYNASTAVLFLEGVNHFC